MAKTAVKSAPKTLPVFELGKKGSQGELALPEFLNIKVSPILLTQAVNTLRKRTRIRRANTKERAEVQGGGRKPWKQKGTGKSRHGSIRSPIWRGGGTTFGPSARHESVVSMPKEMRRRSLMGALFAHAEVGTLAVLRLSAELPNKTQAFLKILPETPRHLLLLVRDAKAADFARVSGNVRGITILAASQVTATDALQAAAVWIDEAALPVLQSRLVSSKAKRV